MKKQIPGVITSHSKISFSSVHVFTLLLSFIVIFSSCQKEVLTPAADSHLPSVTAMDPAYGQKDIETQSTITASFDMNLDPSKFLVNFTVQVDTTMIPGSVSIAGNKATFIPDAPMNNDSQYVVAIDVTDNIPGARAVEKHFMSVFYTKP